MEEMKSAMGEHMDVMADLIEKVSAELRSGIKPAYQNFIGFFHAIDWTEPWIICLLAFHVLVLITCILSRKNINFQMCLFLLAWGPQGFTPTTWGFQTHRILFESVDSGTPVAGVYLAETLNGFLRYHWQSFAGQNYFDSQGLFLSVLWSGPLLVMAIVILVNTLFSLCYLMVRWKRAELRHRARLARKED